MRQRDCGQNERPDVRRSRPLLKVPQDLATHSCINLRLLRLGGVYACEFEKGTREINVRVEGQLTVNDIAVIRNAALHGLGIAFMHEDVAQFHLDAGDLGTPPPRATL